MELGAGPPVGEPMLHLLYAQADRSRHLFFFLQNTGFSS
jgi:hypothetical protein